MRGVAWLAASLALWAAASAEGGRASGEGGRARYTFFRNMSGAGAGGGARRVFGGAGVALGEYPAACALLDRYWAARCSAAVLAARWALTAAHCVSAQLAYVKYNARRPATDGRAAAVLYLYRHPGYRVVQEDEGRGPDVTLLHHDVGLVRTRADMVLSAPSRPAPLRALRRYGLAELLRRDVRVLGFGRAADGARDELLAATLRVQACEREAWLHCACAAAAPAQPAAGVCAGDSGGPVLYRGVQVGVTSMGPLECGAREQAGGAAPSVFTALHEYADVINATILDTEAALRMLIVSRAPPAPLPAPLLAPLLVLLTPLLALLTPLLAPPAG